MPISNVIMEDVMRTVLLRVLLALLLALTPASALTADGNSFNLAAKDKDGNPVPGVTLSLLSGGNKFSAGVTGANGKQTVPLDLGNFQPNNDVRVVVRKCNRDDGTVTWEIVILPPGTQLPPQEKCEDRAAGFFLWPDHGGATVTVNLDASTLAVVPGAPPSGGSPETHKSVSMSGSTPTIQIRGFGGATIVNGNAPSTAGFDGAVLFPLGNRVLVGPMAGFQWVSTSLVGTIGGGPPPSTFINTSVGFKNGNFGGRLGLTLGGWELGVNGGATVAGSSITQNEGFCDPTAGCTISSTTTTHDTVVGPFVGGYISHSIFSHVGIYAEFDYHRLKDNNVFDVSDRAVVGGIVLSFGRRK
jgi:hypothetical protein